jgi:cyclophilin family peptidyl-prolyl cis-trans isomerase
MSVRTCFLSLLALAFTSAAVAAPNAPTYLAASAQTSNTVIFYWNDNSTDETGFEIQYNAGGGWTSLGVTPVNWTSASWTNNAPGLSIQYQVRAVNGSGNSAFTPVVTCTQATFNAPGSLNGLMTGESVLITWADNATTETGCEIETRQLPSGSFSVLGAVGANSVVVDLTGYLAPGMSHEVRVRTRSGASAPYTYTGYSSSITVSPQFTAPTAFSATVQNDSSVLFTWADNSSAETGYEIQYSPASANNFKKLGTSSANATSITLGGFGPGQSSLSPGQSYDFKVRAIFNNGIAISNSAFSSVVTRSTKDGFTSAAYHQIPYNHPFTYQAVVTTLSTRSSWNITGLPTGLTFNSSTGQVTGTPTVYGVYNCPMTATFASGATASTTLTLRVVLPPVVATSIPAQVTTAGGNVSVPLADKFTDPDTTSAARMVTNQGTMDFILYDTTTQTQNATPQTVANFLSYVRNFGVSDTTNKYDGAVFHRSIPGFIVQGGAFKVQSAPNNFSPITTAPSPVNEPVNSNSRGTVAMAKIGGDPNSATNQFFVNLADNSSILDGQNGGFTAFARVAGNGMAVAEAIAALPTVDSLVNVGGVSNTSLTDWPLTSASTVMDTTKMVSITSATKNVPLITYAITGNTNSTAVSASISTTVDGSGISSSSLQINGGSIGQSNVTVTATDLDGNTVSQMFTVTVGEAPVITNGPPPSTAVVGTAYNFAYTASGFPAPSFSHTGTLPPGLSLSSAGVLSGTPTSAGTYSDIVVTASNGIGTAPTQTISITVHQVPAITSSAPAAGIFGTAYTHTYAATGSPAPTYSLTGGTLPGGLSVSSAGVISGTPTTAGTFTGTITATNSAGTFPQAFSITINQAPAFTSSVPTATGLLGTAYSFTCAASGFPAPTFSVPANTLPTGLTLNSTTGEISGTPSATGVFSGTLTASNGIGSNATQAFTITIHQAPAFTNGPPPSPAVVGTAYHFAYAASGFPVPTFSSTGTLPPGLSLSSSGVISGTPTTAGTYPNIVVSASNGIGTAPTQTISITVHQVPAITSSAPPAGVLGIAYSHSFTATGSPTPTFSTTDPLPTGLTLSPEGVLSGTPSALGTFTGTVTATNVVGTSEQAFNIVINQQPAFTNGPPPASGTVGTAYSFSYTASGSPAPTFALTSGALPAGLSLNPSGAISGTPTTAGGPFTGTVTASNGIGTAATQAFSITIAKGTATVTLDDMTLTQTYTGTPKSVTASSTPGGLTIDITYNGSASAPTSHGSHAVLAVVNDSNYSGSASGTLLIQGQSMSNWRTQYFSPEQITAGLADDDSDPDGDGWKNLVEYALGMNPMSRNPALLPVRDANGLTLTFTRPKDMPDVTYGAQSTDNLDGWDALTLEIVTDGPVQTLRARDPLTSGNPSRRIMRLIFDRPAAPIE